MQETKLKAYFPMLKSREEILETINKRENLTREFYSWEKKRREEFLDFCTGARGVKMLYDAFAKELLNPEIYPERLNEILSLLLRTEVTIVKILPNEGARIAAESSLLVMDIVVKLADGSIANVEIQKIGYAFPGQRCACYSADLLLRQFKAVRAALEDEEKFSYRDITNVYTIVFLEKSREVFHQYPGDYLHYFEQKSNTGIELELLQKYIFIPLDIYLKRQENKDISSRLDAWLLFLGSDDPEDIVQLIETYPDFKAMYQQIYDICRNVENIMGLFSKELEILDRNTVRYMMDEMQEEIDRQKKELSQLDEQLAEKNKALAETESVLAERDNALAQKNVMLAEKDSALAEKNSILEKTEADLQAALLRIAQLEAETGMKL